MGCNEDTQGTSLLQSFGHRHRSSQKLELYGLFKQAQEGDNRSSCPGMWDFVGRAKWDAWKAVEGKSRTDARMAYIELARSLLHGGGQEKQEEEWDSEEAGEGGKGSSGLSLGNKVSTMGAIGTEGGEAEGAGDEVEDIFYFAKTGAVKEVQKLLESGAQINDTDEEGRTALHWAADAGQVDVIRLLLEAGADIMCKDGDGDTPLDYAVTCEHDEVVVLLAKWASGQR